MYLKNNDRQLMIDVLIELMETSPNYELINQFGKLVKKAYDESYEYTVKAKEGMKRYRENNRDKARAYSRQYMREYNRKKKEEERVI